MSNKANEARNQSQLELLYLMEKLYNIDEQLGGNKKKAKKKKGQDLFNIIKENIITKTFALTKKQDQRDNRLQSKGRDQEVVKDEINIKSMLLEIKSELQTMENLIEKQFKQPKKYPKEMVVHNEKIFQSLMKTYQDVQDRENGDSSFVKKEEKVKTILELKMIWQDAGKYESPNIKYHPDDEELLAMERWKQKQTEIDSKLEILIDGIGGLKQKAKGIGDQIDHTAILVRELDSKIEDNISTLRTHNQDLKKILFEFRKPSKLIVDIILFGLLVGLLFIMYSMIKKGKK